MHRRAAPSRLSRLAPLLSLCAALSGCVASDLDDQTPPPPEADVIGMQASALDFTLVDKCSDSRHDTFRRDERLVKYMTDPDIISWVTQPVGDHKFHWLVDKFFSRTSTFDEETARRVRDDIGYIRNQIDDIPIRCRDNSECKDDGVIAFTGWQHNRITFCDDYFQKTPEHRAALWVHELSHAVLRTEDRGKYQGPPTNIHDETTRRFSYDEVEDMVNRGVANAATQYEGFVVSLFAEYLDNWYRLMNKGPITEREFNQAVIDIAYGFNPLERVFDTTDRCWDGDVKERDCLPTQTGKDVKQCEHGEWVPIRVCAHRVGPKHE